MTDKHGKMSGLRYLICRFLFGTMRDAKILWLWHDSYSMLNLILHLIFWFLIYTKNYCWFNQIICLGFMEQFQLSQNCWGRFSPICEKNTVQRNIWTFISANSLDNGFLQYFSHEGNFSLVSQTINQNENKFIEFAKNPTHWKYRGQAEIYLKIVSPKVACQGNLNWKRLPQK